MSYGLFSFRDSPKSMVYSILQRVFVTSFGIFKGTVV